MREPKSTREITNLAIGPSALELLKLLNFLRLRRFPPHLSS